MKSLFSLTFAIAMLFSGTTYASDFEMDRGIGFERGRDLEDWVDTSESRSASSGSYASDNMARLYGQSNLAASYGNSIVIQTQPGSHVVLNATQINHGNQTAEVNLKTVQENKYTNVEILEQDTVPSWIGASIE